MLNQTKHPSQLNNINKDMHTQQSDSSSPTMSTKAMKIQRSLKNIHQLKKTQTLAHLKELHSARNKYEKLQQLQAQKNQLIDSLICLKKSAVELIAQKDSQIHKLQIKDNNLTQKLDRLSDGQSLQKQQVRDLIEQLYEMQQKMHKQRCGYAQEMQKKDLIILCLEKDILEIKQIVQEMQEHQINQNRKIRILEDELFYITQQLEEATLALRQTQENNQDAQNTKSDILEIESLNLMQNEKLAKEIQPTCESEDPYSQYKGNLLKKLLQVQKKHRCQLKQISQLYQNKIYNLRQAYVKELHLFDSGAKQSPKESISRLRAHTFDVGDFNIQLKQGGYLQQIIEKQHETDRSSVHNLKEDLKKYQMRALSQYPSPQMIADDASSQFTTKYFQNPYKRFTLRKEISNIDNNMQPVVEEKKIQFEIEEKNEKQLQNDQNNHFDWNKVIVFAAGIVSGWSLNSVFSFIAKKIK